MSGFCAFIVVGAAVAAFLGAACGGSGSDSEQSPADGVIEIRAEQVSYSQNRIEIQAGETVTLRLRNLDDVEHDIEVQGLSAEILSGGGHGDGHGAPTPGTVVVHAEGGATAEVVFRATDRGTYEFFCTVPGHKELGMTGELAVR